MIAITKKLLLLLLVTTTLVTITAACSFVDEADIASFNISEEADNFNVYRSVKVINNRTDIVILEFEGWCSVKHNKQDKQLEITYRVGKDKYYKDFVGLNSRTTYVVTQIDGANVDKYHYTWIYRSKGDFIPVKTKDNDKKEEREE